MKPAFVAIALFLLLPITGRAGEALFGYTVTTDTVPAANPEYVQKQTLREGKAQGHYSAIDFKNGVELGATDKFQRAFYLNSSYNDMQNQYDPANVSNSLPDSNQFRVNGASIEFVYRLISPYTRPLGVAFYIAPEMAVRDNLTGQNETESDLEAKLILQKDFFGDLMITAANLTLQPIWQDMNGKAATVVDAEVTAAANYRILNKWFLGVEYRNHMEFLSFNSQVGSAHFLGPDLHYGGERYWWTLAILPQIIGWPQSLGVGPDGNTIGSSYAYLGKNERAEARLVFGIPFGKTR